MRQIDNFPTSFRSINRVGASRFFYLRYVIFLARIILGGTFIYASIDKIAFPREFSKIVMNYNILPENIAIYFASLLPWIELFLGIFLVIGFFIRESVLALSSLLLVFMVAMIISSLNGTLENCGCFSTSQQKPSPSVPILLTRNIFLILIGGYLILIKRNIKNDSHNHK